MPGQQLNQDQDGFCANLVNGKAICISAMSNGNDDKHDRKVRSTSAVSLNTPHSEIIVSLCCI